MNSDLAGLSLGEFREDTLARMENTLQQNGGLSTRACLLVGATKQKRMHLLAKLPCYEAGYH